MLWCVTKDSRLLMYKFYNDTINQDIVNKIFKENNILYIESNIVLIEYIIKEVVC